MQLIDMNEQDYLNDLPLERTWLADIVDAFLKSPRGEAEIEGILIYLIHKTKRDLGKKGESTITRTINNYCVNSGDTERKCRYPIFKRVGPSQYRLLSYPEPPDLIEIQQIRFSEHAFKRVWEAFCKQVEKKPKWEDMTKRERLIAFAKNLRSNERLQGLLESYRDSADMSDLDMDD